MISRIRRLLIQYLDLLPTNLYPIALEPQITHPSLLFSFSYTFPFPSFCRSEVVLKEQRQAIRIPKQGPLDRDLLDFGSLRKNKCLGWGGIGCGAEVEVILVEIDFESAGSGGGGGCADED